MGDLKRTAVFKGYETYGGKIIDFAGWEMPVQFEGIIEEHEAVRKSAGLFDVSHMGEVEIKGPQALDYVNNLITNDVSLIEDGQIAYSMMCFFDGGIVDDLLAYRYSEGNFLLVINASNIDKDVKWMLDNKGEFDVNIQNISDNVSELAIQGPRAQEILQKLTDANLSDIKFFYFMDGVMIDGQRCLLSRTGYTGEDGFEIYTSNEAVERLWHRILEEGKEYGIKPAGLGARDTLRFEASLPLYGNELSKEITPLEAGLGMFVKLNKERFIGREALLKQKEEGLKRKLVGFEMKERGVPRHGYDVFADGERIGFVTTGYLSPSLQKSIGLALIDIKHTEIGSPIEIAIRNKKVKAEVISKAFYKKNYKK